MDAWGINRVINKEIPLRQSLADTEVRIQVPSEWVTDGQEDYAIGEVTFSEETGKLYITIARPEQE